MKLERAIINNFRSIKKAEISFDHSCRVLLGINESGKSNILKALALLRKGSTIPNNSVRQPLPEEPPVSLSVVDFVFKLSESDIDVISEAIKEKCLNIDTNSVLVVDSNNISVQEFIKRRYKDIIYEVDITTNDRRFTHWRDNTKYQLTLDIYKVAPGNITKSHQLENGTTIQISHFRYFNSAFNESSEANLEQIDADDFVTFVDRCVSEHATQLLPETVFWTYDERNILPASIDLDSFMGNPDQCIPLKNMFYLADHYDIDEAFTDAMKSSTGVKNLLDRVSKRATKHLKSIWKDNKDISFSILRNGSKLEITIKDYENHFVVSERSDGFKQFVSFLLVISAQVHCNKIENCLLLIDEPDISLHPSGAKHLRDELLRISKSNLVVYSTHSIFMVDRDTIERHIIVKKKKERTEIEYANDENSFSEEVLFNAMGFSLFEIIQKNVIIFEGWRDRQLFNIFFDSELKTRFKQFSSCYAKGAKEIRYIAPLIQLANRKCFIVSDGDKVSLEKKAEFERDRVYGKWLTYSDLTPKFGAFTAEDYIKPEVLRSAFRDLECVKQLHLEEEVITSGKDGVIKLLEGLFSRKGVPHEQIKSTINTFKDSLFLSLKRTEIVEEYSQVADSLLTL